MTPVKIFLLLLVGASAGYLSGLFGIGGGVIIVPLLVLIGFEIMNAAAISLGAVLVISIVGTVAYTSLGQIDWVLAGLIAVGSVFGAQLGGRLLNRLTGGSLRIAFAVLLLLIAVSLSFSPPVREATIDLNWLTAVGAVFLGIVVGVLATVFGIGGGVLLVPALMLGFGVGDLVARGTAIAVMIPTSISGLLAHLRAGRANYAASLLVGAGSVFTTAAGAYSAHLLNPHVGNLLFAVFLAILASQFIWSAFRTNSSH